MDDRLQPKIAAPGSAYMAGLSMALLVGLLLTLVLALVLLGCDNGPALSPVDASGTAEAVQFATAETARQATREVVGATQTAVEQVTATRAAMVEATSSAVAASTATAEARATAQAPATHTAEALVFEQTRAQAQATITVLVQVATQVAAPSSGTLEQRGDDQVACASVPGTFHDFIAEATFENPNASHPWDYAIVFSNLGDNSDYRMMLNSTGRWSLGLHSEGFDIENRDKTPLLKLDAGAKNTLKFYVTGESVHLFVNGGFIDTLDLVMFGQGPPPGTEHEVSICSGLQKENAVAGRKVNYEGFAVWALP